MDEIQLQFKVNETIRSSIISVPNTYKELEDEIRKQVKRLNTIEFGMTYENHDCEHVVLNKGPRCLRIAIPSSPVIPGTDLKRLKVEIFEGSSPSVRIKDKTHDDEEKTACSNSSVSHPTYDKSPLKKRLCSASDNKRRSLLESSTFCRKFLQFPSEAKSNTFQRRSVPAGFRSVTDDDDEDEASENPFDKVSTPFQRYVDKTQEQIRLKENSLRELQDKLADFNDRLKHLKARYGDAGKMCHNCHLRFNHTSRNCIFDSCTSLFDCGQEKFHPGENTAKQYTMSINKLKNEIDQLRRDLDNKLAASRKVKASISHSIEQQLLEENSDNYYEGSVKNWTLLRKHVYALQSYSKKYMNGKIPPRHQLVETLDAALDECQLENTRVCQAKPVKDRNFPSKNLLERHGVEFPKKDLDSTKIQGNEYKCSSSFSRLLPENELEEAEQLEISIRESLRSNNLRGQCSNAYVAPQMSGDDSINEVQEITRSEHSTISRPIELEPITQITPNSSAIPRRKVKFPPQVVLVLQRKRQVHRMSILQKQSMPTVLLNCCYL